MLFQRVLRTDPEKVFVLGKASGTLVVDQVVSWDATSITNNNIQTPATATLGLVAGVLTKALATDAYGLVQAYGYYPTALCTMKTSGSTDGALGTPLYAKASQVAWEYAAAADTVSDGKQAEFAVALEAITFVTTVTSQQHKVFLRCL